MKTVFVFLIMFLGSSCTNIEKPLIDAEKDKIIGETKAVVNAIYQAAEKCDPVKLTATYFDSPDFISLINRECADYEQTVKKYPILMSEYKSQRPKIISEKYSVLDASTVLYTSASKWDCTLKNDSIAVCDNCILQLLLKKTNNQWKVLSWTEVY